ncbi:glutamate synthase large subunit [Algoriphagus aquimarinus]|uniref:Glutamate synthase [NADPH] large chain n=1 Tax=Algoriphagus aquimarinus TaxID=237018 RepID=A0A1I0VVM1_9BACT|nr:glutamate synthase large subunit [Algoriphagus aquimarinus]SFA80499.1 glutamate synthase (NADH) large subunit [Algoriphagus aquimarinus]|tara:strand:+ start:133438 stop:137928 length:4491 start_codon:yes stop_codon:yes gene_type:complete
MQEGLYRSEFEHDSCGIGAVVDLSAVPSHETISDALYMLSNMEHRGGRGSDPKSGDGAGILIQVPHQFLKDITARTEIELPEAGSYGVGMTFFPKNKQLFHRSKELLNQLIEELDFELIGYRSVPVDETVPGSGALEVMPNIEQLFVKHKKGLTGIELERKLYVLRNYSTSEINTKIPGVNQSFYFASLSSQTLIYKGQLRTDQVLAFYKDLQNSKIESAFAIVHSRFSTNTFPNWRLAQPFRFLSHNGEINTIKGNLNKMKSKENLMKSKYFTDEELSRLMPITDKQKSDSANLDAMVELLTLSGRSLPHAMMMLVPEAWQDNEVMDRDRKSFYKFHASLVEPWDGPAALLFTDGKSVGATLDRNGLRPLRYFITQDKRLILSSEAGALPIREATILEKGRISPGRMIWADLEKGRVLFDEEVKGEICSKQPYEQWVADQRIKLRMEDDPKTLTHPYSTENIKKHQTIFGYTSEELKVVLSPMGDTAYEAIGSMGADTPLAVLSKESQHISNYFKQLFAQVSNPPIDPIRERLVMSLFTRLGVGQNILEESPKHTRQIHISQPVLLNEDLEKVKNMEGQGYRCATLTSHFLADHQPGRLLQALDKLCDEAEKAINEGKNVIIISDRNSTVDYAPIPSLLAIGAVHHHLVKKKIRTSAGLVLESGDIRETHHFATAIGYGASAINPYMALESLLDMYEKGELPNAKSQKKLFSNYQSAIGKGLLKVLSKMGISTLQSYQSAQIFEALGLGPDVIDRCFKGTISRISGISFNELAEEVLIRHRAAYETESPILEQGGVYQWKRRGEKHLFNPETIHLLQKSTRLNDFGMYKKFAAKINEQSKDALTLRGLFEFKKRISVPIDEVEPASSIMRRFATGAMSFGSISHEAHSTLAIAMNRMGAKSNSGEGGEDEIRFAKKENGDWERSAIKQVASGRFGVTSNYLTNAAELQIKMAQGAKPGEGGQLPGHKVDDWIGRVRHSTPGVGLISPPPHHDIYSIEDLAQLIYDLKNANRKARINVKLVSQAGVGTVAAGVAKAMADVILISGADGGTGASPLSSIRHAGLPWELGLSEAHQTLVKNNLRSRVVLQTDGQLRTGRDLAIATLLGAEEWGISTAALVVEGCIMMRKCHLNTCPVGIATQNPDLRKLFTGDPDHVVNFFQFLVQDLREIMASLGFRTVNEMVGQSNVLQSTGHLNHWKWDKVDLSPIFHKVEVPDHVGIHKQIDQEFELKRVLDRQLIKAALPSLEQALASSGSFSIKNIDRSVGAMLSNEISKIYGSPGLPEDTINFKFTGSAGQTFGGFLTKGVNFELEGEANDYFGKGLSGGKLIVYPSRNAKFVPEENIIIGNVAFYGATSGEAYINGKGGERFCVRNSGVQTVVEGIGDHGCEYMTGGLVVNLGEIGRNFAAGMSGGIAYILKEYITEINPELVDIDNLEDEDFNTIKTFLKRHIKLTKSGLGTRFLEDWDKTKEKFIKVIPRDYKAVLEKRALEQSKSLA